MRRGQTIASMSLLAALSAALAVFGAPSAWLGEKHPEIYLVGRNPLPPAGVLLWH